LGIHEVDGDLPLSAGQHQRPCLESALAKNVQLPDERRGMWIWQNLPGSYKAPQFRQDAIIFWQALETSSGDFNDGSSDPTEGITKFIR